MTRPAGAKYAAGDLVSAGDLVFAKVKGYPPWPARITSCKSALYKVFFYGTYENATLRRDFLWPYNEENVNNFGPKNMSRKGYAEGLDQIRNTPDMAPYESDGNVEATNTMEMSQDSTIDSTSAPHVIDKTPTSTDSTPVAAPKVRATAISSTPALTTSGAARGTKRKTIDSPNAGPSKRPSLEDSQSEHEMTSRSSRMIKSQKLHENTIKSPRSMPESGGDGGTMDTFTKVKATKKVAVVAPTRQVGGNGDSNDKKRKIRIKVKSTGELIEINLDETPNFASNEQKVECERTLASKVSEFRERVTNGEFKEIQNLLKKSNDQLSLDEKELLKNLNLDGDEKDLLAKERKLANRKNKVQLLQIEQKMVDLDIAIKMSLHSDKPNLQDIIIAIDELYKLTVTPLMLKKLYQVVTTIRWLIKYPGPKDYVDSEDKTARENIFKMVEAIQQKAEQVYSKYRGLFSFQGGAKHFWVEFEKLIEEFKVKTKDMEERDVLCLIRDPTVDSINTDMM